MHRSRAAYTTQLYEMERRFILTSYASSMNCKWGLEIQGLKSNEISSDGEPNVNRSNNPLSCNVMSTEA